MNERAEASCNLHEAGPGATSGVSQIRKRLALPPKSSPPPALAPLDDRIAGANRALEARVGNAMDLPVQVLVEQRNAALKELTDERSRSLAQLNQAAEDNEKFVGYLMEEQLSVLGHLREQLRARDEELGRMRTLGGETSAADARRSGTGDAEQLEQLRAELKAAFSEVDEARAEAAGLQEERDEAIRATDDVRLGLEGELDATRDEAFELQSQLDATERQLNDLRDLARDEAVRLNEELAEQERQLDTRNAEVRRLRKRLGDAGDGVQHSRPPPPAVAADLESSRTEAKWLRQELIEAKRQLSRLEAAEAARVAVPRPPGPPRPRPARKS